MAGVVAKQLLSGGLFGIASQAQKKVIWLDESKG